MTDAVAIEIGDDYVATIELRRPPNNLSLRGNVECWAAARPLGGTEPPADPW